MTLWCLPFPQKNERKSFFGWNRTIFVRFFEEIEDIINHFEINWPLLSYILYTPRGQTENSSLTFLFQILGLKSSFKTGNFWVLVRWTRKWIQCQGTRTWCINEPKIADELTTAAQVTCSILRSLEWWGQPPK